MTPARISQIAPITRIAVSLYYMEAAASVLILVILVFTVLTAARESYKAEMDEFSTELKAVAEALDRRIGIVYQMTLAEVEAVVLEKNAVVVNLLRKARGLPELSPPAPKSVDSASVKRVGEPASNAAA